MAARAKGTKTIYVKGDGFTLFFMYELCSIRMKANLLRKESLRDQKIPSQMDVASERTQKMLD